MKFNFLELIGTLMSSPFLFFPFCIVVTVISMFYRLNYTKQKMLNSNRTIFIWVAMYILISINNTITFGNIYWNETFKIENGIMSSSLTFFCFAAGLIISEIIIVKLISRFSVKKIQQNT
jgi:Na+/H+-translocating membrane pyrophosphatase